MFQNYLYVAFRNLKKNILFSLINILGLAIGLAASIMIMLFVMDELSYDTFWADSDRIYRVQTDYNMPGREPFITVLSPGGAKVGIEKYFEQDLEAIARISNLGPTAVYNGKSYQERVFWSDPAILDILNFEVVAGDMRQALADKASMAINQSVAKKYFGDEDPIGKVIKLNAFTISRDYKVAAVYKDIPHNSALDMPALVKMDPSDFEDVNFFLNNWYSVNHLTFLKVKQGVDVAQIENRLPAMIDANVTTTLGMGDASTKPSDLIKMNMLNIKKIQLESSGLGEMKPTGDKDNIVIFSSIAFLILMIACVNFINLSTAKASKRAKEVSLRKVLGAGRQQLMIQFLSESVLLALFGGIVALVLIEVLLPAYGSFLNKDLAFHYFNAVNLAVFISLILFIGIVGGIYPALIISGFRPAMVLKANKSSDTGGTVLLRNILVVFQFAVSISLIIGTLVVFSQKNFMATIDPGYNIEKLMVVSGVNRAGIRDKKQTFFEQVAKIPGVTSVTLNGDSPSDSNESNVILSVPGQAELGTIMIGNQVVDYDYFKTYEIDLLAGRTLNKNTAQDTIRPPAQGGQASQQQQAVNILINEAAAKKIGHQTPDAAIGTVLRQDFNGQTRLYTVVGVVGDTIFQSRKRANRPELYQVNPQGQRSLTLRYQGSGADVQEKVRNLWTEVAPEVPFIANFVKDRVEREFRAENKMAIILAFFSALAIFVACLGLYGLASFTAEKRTKEIGIRKVMGATVVDIVRLLLWQFSKPVIVANAIAWPMMIYVMIQWLENFPYRIETSVLFIIAVIASLIAVMVAWLTIGSNAAGVARKNPIQALRYE